MNKGRTAIHASVQCHSLSFMDPVCNIKHSDFSHRQVPLMNSSHGAEHQITLWVYIMPCNCLRSTVRQRAHLHQPCRPVPRCSPAMPSYTNQRVPAPSFQGSPPHPNPSQACPVMYHNRPWWCFHADSKHTSSTKQKATPCQPTQSLCNSRHSACKPSMAEHFTQQGPACALSNSCTTELTVCSQLHMHRPCTPPPLHHATLLNALFLTRCGSLAACC